MRRRDDTERLSHCCCRSNVGQWRDGDYIFSVLLFFRIWHWLTFLSSIGCPNAALCSWTEACTSLQCGSRWSSNCGRPLSTLARNARVFRAIRLIGLIGLVCRFSIALGSNCKLHLSAHQRTEICCVIAVPGSVGNLVSKIQSRLSCEGATSWRTAACVPAEQAAQPGTLCREPIALLETFLGIISLIRSSTEARRL